MAVFRFFSNVRLRFFSFSFVIFSIIFPLFPRRTSYEPPFCLVCDHFSSGGTLGACRGKETSVLGVVGRICVTAGLATSEGPPCRFRTAICSALFPSVALQSLAPKHAVYVYGCAKTSCSLRQQPNATCIEVKCSIDCSAVSAIDCSLSSAAEH
jgi:hypothetical protein